LLDSLLQEKLLATMRNIVQLVGEQTVVSEWRPAQPGPWTVLDTNTGHLMRFKYDKHDVTVAFSHNSPDLGEIRVGQSFKFTGPRDSLEIRLLKTAVRNGKVKELDFSLTLGKGGRELVFVYVEDNHLTIKGHRFAGQSSSHILFQCLLFPFLQRKVVEFKDNKKEVKVEVSMLEIIDLTNEDDVKEEYTEEEVQVNGLKRERNEEASIEELDVKKVKVEELSSVKGETGPLPSTLKAIKHIYRPSPALSTILESGSTPVTRSELMKGLWIYIKKHNLQDPTDRSFFTPNLGMHGIFGSDRIRACSMGKFLKNHLSLL